MPGRRTQTRVPGRKTDNMNALLVPIKRTWAIKLPQFKNPISIDKKNRSIWYLKILEISRNQTYKSLMIGSSRWQDFKRMSLVERWVPGTAMRAIMSFYRAPDDIISYVKVQQNYDVWGRVDVCSKFNKWNDQIPTFSPNKLSVYTYKLLSKLEININASVFVSHSPFA